VILKLVYLPLALLASLMVGITFIPLLLLEEKEKKTLRMLLVTPASVADILVGKLLVVLVFQLAITSVVRAILGGFTGAVPFVLLYVSLGACFSLSSGLLFGSLFSSVQSAGTVSGLVSFVFIISGIFVGQLGELLSKGPVLQIVRFIPTYYLADGVVNASQNLGTLGSNLLDIGIILGRTVVFLAISAWALRRQASVLAMI
jgi:ABC-2 type transport system permease protein